MRNSGTALQRRDAAGSRGMRSTDRPVGAGQPEPTGRSLGPTTRDRPMRPKKRTTRKKSRERFQKIQVDRFDKVAKDFRFEAVRTGEFRFRITAASDASRKSLTEIAQTIEPAKPLAPAFAAAILLQLATKLFREDEDDANVDPTENIANIDDTTGDTFEIELLHGPLQRTVLEIANKQECTTARAVEILLQGGAAVLSMQETLAEPHTHGDHKIH